MAQTAEEPKTAPADAPAALVKEQASAASAAPLAFEKAQKEAKFKKKGRKFPWLWVILGVGVVATVILLLSKKKSSVNYALTVTLATGVNGTPAAGAYAYKSGTKIDYSYTPGPGYDALEVKLDGNILAASGQITMDQDHVLTVTARNANYNYDIDVLGFNWIAVPAGDFQMGDNFGVGDSWERPVHTVNLSAYSIAKYEVTFSQYDVFCTETGRTLPSDSGRGRGSRPVINVSWEDSKAFCDWLAAKTGKNIHLATDAQWERAAAGTDQRLYPWGSATPTCSYAVFSGCGGGTQPVGSRPAGASAVGAMDMAGNAWEWVQDWFSETYYQECQNQGTVKNPQGPASGENRVQRSGSYTVKPVRLRCSFRDYNYPGYSSPALSFRVVWEQ
jgi:formylglycine-generating enzyme required for sulfatase activity